MAKRNADAADSFHANSSYSTGTKKKRVEEEIPRESTYPISQGSSFGQRRPPLTELIASVLGRYPDGGQILKELIQNADDAGATEVKFLYDDKNHGTNSLVTPELEKFQGPALYCYNNAMFQESDWDGIQNFMRSNKKKDPLKVGRFGIGFNSVYHITDLPSIVSGTTVAFLDPHEIYFGLGEAGRQFDIKRGLLNPQLFDQFSPFHDIFGCDLSSTRSYDSTLFRFPLRKSQESKLSKTVYNEAMVDKLFDSLREEASIILLYLKSVQSISIFRRVGDGDRLNCVFKVHLSDETREQVIKERKKMLAAAMETASVVESNYIIGIHVLVDDEIQSTEKWLVVNRIGSTNERIEQLRTQLILLPWIGLAVPINENRRPIEDGRIFCFLPLPPDVDCRTGLPVHIHGYFGLTDSRRGLVWPGKECQNNETAEWNELLLTEIASIAYCKMLEALVTNQPDTAIDKAMRRDIVYSTMPVLNDVRGHWQCILKPMFQQMINQPVFHALKADASSWIPLSSGVLDRLRQTGTSVDHEVHKVVLKVLCERYSVITDVPSHILEIVQEFFSGPTEISPALVRGVLKQPGIANIINSRKEKLNLLTYVLSDGNTADITGISLLPLADSSFIKFCEHKHFLNAKASVLVPHGNCTAELLPNMSSRFLDENLQQNIKSKLYGIAAINTNEVRPTQLVRLTKEIVVDNMRASLPPAWFCPSSDKVPWEPGSSAHPPQNWLEAIWNWINESYAESLALFEGIPLLPIGNQLGVLSKNSKFIFRSEGNSTKIPAQVCDLLAACGCTVLSSLPWYIQRHKEINAYVAPPTPRGVLNVLSQIPRATVVAQASQILTSESRSVFLEFISHLHNPIANPLRSLLLELPLFMTIHGAVTAGKPSQLQQLKAVSADLNLPSHFEMQKDRVLIVSTDSNVQKVLSLLDVQFLSSADMLMQYVLPDISANRYINEQISVLMRWIFERITIFQSQNQGFLEEMKKLAFIPTKSGTRKRPCELYDPNDSVLRDILETEKDVFPTGFYTNPESIATLKRLGLKTKETLTACDLLEFAQMVASSTSSSPLVFKKFTAVITILNDNPSYQNNYSSRRTLKEDLSELRWIPCAANPPPSYPNFLQWYSNPVLMLPSEFRSVSKAPLIGSSMPTLDIDINRELQQAFGIIRDPPLPCVIQQLQAAVAAWKAHENRHLPPIEVAKFEEMLAQIYRHLSKFSASDISSAVANASLQDWIWHGRGFCPPRNVALSMDFKIDLRPQLFLLAEEFRSDQTLVEFFLQHGVNKKFSNEDILGVLDSIRLKHADSTRLGESEVTQDFNVCCDILRWVVKDRKVLPEHLQEKVFVPVQSPKNALVLAACKKCTYCDRDWLRKGGSELDIPGDYQVIHDSVSVEVARLLGVPALSTCLLSAETMGFEQTGPHESITNRIKTILQEYTEGVGIFKELIQNADDARASVVRFIVDWRNGRTETLLSPNMASSQGPALWAYNNENFSDHDFENINKLAGATKAKEVGKIGRFGLGFNAVYHLTDVPSFVSRNYFVLFDPNVNHIDNHIPDKSRPGIRINLASNPRPLSAFEDQFQPYNGVFGCCTQPRDVKFNYDGTLFRFPFRTCDEARKSEICRSVYGKEKVKQIVTSLKESSSLLLLFTQHVTLVELYEIEDGSAPSDMKLLLSLSKQTPEIRSISDPSLVKCPFIEDCSNWWQLKLTNPLARPVTPLRCELFEVLTKAIQCNLMGNPPDSETRETWLVTSSGGTGSSVLLASGDGGRSRGLLPCGGAAARLKSVSSNRTVPEASLKVDAIKGEAFCFLPLSIPTGLPVHVNGYFAVTSNRRGIWERTTSLQEQQIEVQWNESLLEDALSRAYVQLLNEVKTLQTREYAFYKLWPVYCDLQSTTWGRLLQSVYSTIVSNSLPLFYSDGQLLSINEGYILDDELCKIPQVRDALKELNKYVFDIPSQVVSSLIKAGQEAAVRQRTLNLNTFLEEMFLPNVQAIPKNIRDPIVGYILDCILNGRNEFAALLSMYACVTCSHDGNHLAKPSRLVNPNGPVASLFLPEDRRFPVGDCFLTKNRLYALELLGMVKDRISWSEICDRANSVKILAEVNGKQALERTRNLIKYLNENMEKLAKPDDISVSHLRTTEFLPFLSTCPDGYELSWEGSRFKKQQLFAPNNAYLSSEKHLVGSSCVIIDDSKDTGCGELGIQLKKLLGFRNRLPTVEQVVRQLDAAICASGVGSTRRKSLASVCKRVYKFFEDMIMKADRSASDQTQVEWLLKQLSEKPWLLIEGQFIPRSKVAYEWEGSGAPYLFGLPAEYHKYDKLFKTAGVKQRFSSLDFFSALTSLQQTKAGNPLNDAERKLAVRFATELKDHEIAALIGEIPLPDKNNVLCRSGELTINLTFWLKDRGDARYVHEDIPAQLALDLGAKSLHDRRLKKYSSTIGTPFGQHEKLTDRLKNILKSYPCDSGILKELVQNADDAGATEIHFVYDTRKLPNEKVIQNYAEEVQGPALCVYNNRPFTQEDLEGIQKLGIGSKTDDPEKTGQYGIGFNAVYHLTDCPSFLSNGNTLCFLDPHCRYAPEATPDCPGELFQPINEEFKEDFEDVFLGYLSDHFTLEGATMFRLPLRTNDRSRESLISCKYLGNYKMKELLDKFKAESKKMLLFLNHVKKISLSEIDKNGRFMVTYRVVADIEEENEEKRCELSRVLKSNKSRPRSEVPRSEITYPLRVSDSAKLTETWLVHQCCGRSSQVNDDPVPDGRQYGLFPRGGIAALMSPQRSTSEYQPEHVAYCFLPLPVYTGLPVHVNGHFALDSSRRNLWHDTNPNSPLTRWNNFLKKSVLAPGYATLINEARQYLPFSQDWVNNGLTCSFKNVGDARRALHWYHQLFPDPSKDPQWSILAREVFRCLGNRDLKVLPEVVADDSPEVTSQHQPFESSKNVVHRVRSWLSVKDAYFVEGTGLTKLYDDRLLTLLLRVHLPLLLYSPHVLFKRFKEAEVTCHVLTPMSVIIFLKSFTDANSNCQIGNLPTQLARTNMREMLDLMLLIDYCKVEEQFPNLLEGLPLLLTADGQLRVFSTNDPVYRSTFSDLFPARANLFLHPSLVHSLPEIDKLPERRVMVHLTVNSLKEHFPGIFPASMKNTSEHVPWAFPKCGPLSRQWFQRLWEFLRSYAARGRESLSVLGVWPIIPTTNDELVTINNGKTVLDATPRSTHSAQGNRVREILKKLDCPILNTEITMKKPFNPTAYSLVLPTDYAGNHVTDPYVAQPHKVQDVLQVFDFMRRMGSLDASKLTDSDLYTLLSFFQDDLKNLTPNDAAMLQQLPFYVGIDGKHFSLSQYTCYVVIPLGVPTAEIEKLQRDTRCLFLRPVSGLDAIYERLGVGVRLSLTEFYSKYIIPRFNIFNRESQITYLKHIKDKVLPLLPALLNANIQRNVFLNFLIGSECIPDEEGVLHYASEFYDPRNKVFAIMIETSSKCFPPSLFNATEWLPFLSEIGMKTRVDENQYLEFCQAVAKAACTPRDRMVCVEKSKVLVDYLFKNKHLRSESFLCSLSNIKYIASKKVESSLLSLHKQFQCNTVEDEPPFVQFFDAVPWKYHILTWTSTHLLPTWATPGEQLLLYSGEQLLLYLGVQEVPSVESIVTHLQNLSRALAEVCKRNEVLPQPPLLKKIMESIYEGLYKEIECRDNKDISNRCHPECKLIGERLKSSSCVLVEDGKVLVSGDKLSFAAQIECTPFLYTVPRKYFAYEHLMKRLGATEQFISLQFANVLRAIYGQCQNTKSMNPDLFDKAKVAMQQLILNLLHERRSESKTKIDDLKELFLPTENGMIVNTSDLILKVAPRFKNALAKCKNVNVMLPLEKCDLPREKEKEYFNALPQHLRPKLFESLFREVLDPKCLGDRCALCENDSSCEFVRRYILIIKSPEFQSGIIRLLKHKKNSNELTEEEQDRLSVFGKNKLEIVCMRNIYVHLVDANIEKPLENSSIQRSCYAVKSNSSWKLYIQRSTAKSQVTFLSDCINRISHTLFDDACLQAISTMLLCESPSQIPGILDELSIDEDFAEELKLGKEVPEVFYYLLQQNPLFIFYKGEIVAYGIDKSEEHETEEEKKGNACFTAVKYVLAKVISRCDENETDDSYDFTAEYLIDLGSERKKASVVDLYKFVQNDAAENPSAESTLDNCDSTSMPSSFDEAKREIQEALRRAFRLSAVLRRKVIRRLYLRWHPDKNPNNAEFANKMFQFLLSEIKRMEVEESGSAKSFGFTTLFTGWNRQARRERETYWNFRSCGGFGSSTHSTFVPFTVSSTYTSPNPLNANRWIQQAKRDLEAARFLFSASQSFNALVCFLSHQVVEKSLKATLYAKCGLNNDQLHTHDVYSLADRVSRLSGAPGDITGMAIVVSNYYLSTRYPNQQPGAIVPADAFSREQTQRALEKAGQLLEVLQNFIEAA